MKIKSISLSLVLLCLVFSHSISFSAEEDMTLKKMESIVKEMSTESEGENGQVKFVFKNVTMLLVSDAVRNRMRIIAPIANYADLDRIQIDAAMISNFHLALDARYAVREGVLYSVFIHPLKELTEEQVKSAMRQVSNLALTFGTQYSSGEMTFGLKREEKPVH